MVRSFRRTAQEALCALSCKSALWVLNLPQAGALGKGQQVSFSIRTVRRTRRQAVLIAHWPQFNSFWFYVTPIMGGIIADCYLGRYNTIMLFTFVYMYVCCCSARTHVQTDLVASATLSLSRARPRRRSRSPTPRSGYSPWLL